jgi:hypothetical protein
MAALVRADERLKEEFLITVPVLILHGTLDKNTKPTGSQHFYYRVGSVDKMMKLYEGSFHDLLNDIDKGMVMQDILGWVNARLPATPLIFGELSFGGTQRNPGSHHKKLWYWPIGATSEWSDSELIESGVPLISDQTEPSGDVRPGDVEGYQGIVVP